MKNKPKQSIAELKALLESEDTTPITILPDGRIKGGGLRKSRKKKPTVVTLRENLGGEYGSHELTED